MIRKILFLSAIVIFLTTGLIVYADKRSYVWTYEYMTMPKGRAEIEYYLTAKIPDLADFSVNTLEYQIEFEYGITDHWDISLYQRFKQKNNKEEADFTYEGFKIRTRYRLGEKGQFLLDPLLYFEYIRDADSSKPNVVEVKIILAKDIGNFNFAYNQILKQEFETGGLTENEYAFGVNYKVSPRFRIGLESKGNYTDNKYYLGPTVSFLMARSWLALGVVSGLNNESDEFQTRLIFGLPF